MLIERQKKQVITDGKLPDVHTEIYYGYAYLFIRNITEQFRKNIECDD